MRRVLLVLFACVAVAVLGGAVVALRLEHARLEPTGRFAVGVKSFVWTQAGRSDPFTGGNRAIPVAFYYPAVGTADGALHVDAPIQTAVKHPLVLLSADLGGLGLFYRTFASELASRGIMVALVGHPGLERWSWSGRRLRAWAEDSEAIAALRQEGGWSAVVDLPRYEGLVTEGARDVRFVLDQVNDEAHARTDPFFVQIRVGEIGTLGHGWGGAAALLACKEDARCSAAASLDGPPPTPTAATPWTEAVLVISTGQDPLPALERVYETAAGAAYHARIASAQTLDLTDLPRLLPRAWTKRFGPSSRTPKAHQVLARDLVLAFFSRHLLHLPSPALDRSVPFTDVVLDARGETQ